MSFFPAFYYARSFSAFDRPSRPVYHKAPSYLMGTAAGNYCSSSPFILNYLKVKYGFDQLLGGGSTVPADLKTLVANYRRYPKPARHFVFPITFSGNRPIVLQYHQDRRLVIYQAVFFKRFLFYFFQYRTFQFYAVAAIRSTNPPIL